MNRPALQVAFFTAQADRRSCALSPLQRDFLRRIVGGTTIAVVDRNFPYDAATPPWRRLPLWRESLNVVRQYHAAKHPEFAEQHRAAALRVIARAEVTVFLAGSCGLELLRRLNLPAPALVSVTYVAFGVVARERVRAPGLVVLGRRDWIARGRGPSPDRRVDCDHLGYLANEEFAALCTEFVHARYAALCPAHAAAF